MPIQTVISAEDIVFDPKWPISKHLDKPEKKESLFKFLDKSDQKNTSCYVGRFPLIPANTACHLSVGRSSRLEDWLIDKVCLGFSQLQTEQLVWCYDWFFNVSPWKNAFEEAIIVKNKDTGLPVSYLFPKVSDIKDGLFTTNALLASRQFTEHTIVLEKRSEVLFAFLKLQYRLQSWHCALNKMDISRFVKGEPEQKKDSKIESRCNHIWYDFSNVIPIPEGDKKLKELCERIEWNG